MQDLVASAQEPFLACIEQKEKSPREPRKTEATTMKIPPTLCPLLLLLLSLDRASTFAPLRHHRSRLIAKKTPDSCLLPRNRPYLVALYVKENDDEDEYYDEDVVDQEDFYGKFEKESKMHQQEEEEGDSIPPLPTFYEENGSTESTSIRSASSPPVYETQRRIEEQQRQIDMLMKLVKQQLQQQPQDQPQDQQSQFNQLSEVPTSTFLPPLENEHSSDAVTSATSVAPLKAMLFIDGTWLYYSIYERNEHECPIVRRYGRGWQARYQFDWAALIQVISQQLQRQHPWNSSQNVEITRASVYTSCKKDTSKYSKRIKMFDEMRAANYDVFMLETVGPGEKCVDIQLAVEMLHYATVPNAYDVAILLRCCMLNGWD